MNQKIPEPGGNPFDIPGMTDLHIHGKNYEIIPLDGRDDRCFIFFSGNGLYYPNNEETFHRVIVQDNRFEWKRNIPPFANKAIFLRDITKQLYLEGINGSINSIEKLTAFLKENTRGNRVICVGSSGGGYAAMLFGCLLKAHCVFNFAGPYSLDVLLQTPPSRASYPVLEKYEHDEKFRDCFCLSRLLKTTHTPVMYFYPARCPFDIAQSRYAEGISSVYPFRFDTGSHPATCFEMNFPDLFAREMDDLIRLHARYRDTMISPLAFSCRTSGIPRTLRFGARRILKRGLPALLDYHQS